MTHGFKLCPQCREEYTLVAEVCAECGVALVSPDEAPAPVVPEAFPEVSALECVRVGPLPWTRALSEVLSDQGIGHRVELDTRSEAEGGVDPLAFGGEIVYGTWVRPEDLPAAAELNSQLFRFFEPEAEHESDGDDACPACQTPLAADALECPDCGLVFG